MEFVWKNLFDIKKEIRKRFEWQKLKKFIKMREFTPTCKIHIYYHHFLPF